MIDHEGQIERPLDFGLIEDRPADLARQQVRQASMVMLWDVILSVQPGCGYERDTEAHNVDHYDAPRPQPVSCRQAVDILRFSIYRYSMPLLPMPKGALAMLILRVVQSGPLHGYAIAQRIRRLSGDVLEAEEGSLYPALQRLLVEGWVTAEWGTSETGRRVRFYRLNRAGVKQLEQEQREFEQATTAIQAILRHA
jgi:PadR family transcriptional regulator, regulatory protein PadR